MKVISTQHLLKWRMLFISFFSTLKGGDLTKQKNEIGFVPFCASYKGYLEGSSLFFKVGCFFTGALFPHFFNFGKLKFAVCSFLEFLAEVSYRHYQLFHSLSLLSLK